jgi:hypothetical protein
MTPAIVARPRTTAPGLGSGAAECPCGAIHMEPEEV